MNINRRDVLKVGAASVAAIAATAITGCAGADAKPDAKAEAGTKKILGKHQVVVIGGGFGGLTVAKDLMKKDKNFDVLVIEKNDTFMSCPFSNTNLGKLEGVNLGTFVFDYAQPVDKHGYSMLHSEVVAIDRKAKTVTTAAGVVEYGILVLSPGIAYDYEGQFPTWSKEKIGQVARKAPSALIPGSEHVALERQLTNMEDGDVVITVPNGKFRCPPAPFERASMIAAYMNKEGIQGKVIVLNPKAKFAKFGAFMESWKELYADRIVYVPNSKVDDVDVNAKTISYSTAATDMDEASKKTIKYEVLNLMPNNRSNPVVDMAGLETSTDSFKKVLMNGCSFQTKTDKDVYAVGDVVAHAIPPSGQTANWSGKQCAEEIAHRLHKKEYTLPVKTASVKAGNVCYSMVGDKPEEAIMVTHDFSWTGTVIKGAGHVPKAPNGKFRSKGTAKATRDWYRGIMADLFS
ncbi:FAD-dependent oxidoreductase [Sulfurimonas sp.]|uniref:FAD-dependent oxidoreductase n=1 Tax=Sulfurimonas sp. TaxID=2022749 RepID=UPI0035613ACC